MDRKEKVVRGALLGIAGVGALCLVVAFLTGQLFERSGGPVAPLSSPTRSGALELAQRYVSHPWQPEERHVFHGIAPDGIRVDTPDVGFREAGSDPAADADPDSDDVGGGGSGSGWWTPGEPAVGIPYKWGGFDTPESFDAGLAAGKFAGDTYSAEKRRLLDDGVSEAAVGVDCSGFVSRCWDLPRSYSTRELPSLCDRVDDLADLQPGDIMNTHNRHVRLFAGWEDEVAGRAFFYEASRRVQKKAYDVQAMVDDGYEAWRYRGMRDG